MSESAMWGPLDKNSISAPCSGRALSTGKYGGSLKYYECDAA